MTGRAGTVAVRIGAVTFAILIAVASPGNAGAAPFTQAELTNAGGAKGDGLAFSLAVSRDGSTIVTGAPGADSLSGAAYVYQRGAGTWGAQSGPTKLSPPSGVTGAQFGWSVAVSDDGSVIVVGAPYANSDNGAAYVFVRGPSGWSEMATLTAAVPGGFESLGKSVTISGDGSVVAAGAPGAGSGQGKVYVFLRSSAWGDEHETQALTASGAAAGDALGSSLASSDDGSVIVAGAPGTASSQGAAYVFQRSTIADTGWVDSGKLTATDGAAADELGFSVATTGVVVIAGAPDASSGQGAAYVFDKPFSVTGRWRNTTDSAKLTGPDAAAGDAVGEAVAITSDGSLVTAGAPTTTALATAGSGPGSVYTFAPSGSSWTNGPQLTASDGVKGDDLGFSVAISDAGVIATGAPHAGSEQGAAYAYTNSSSTAIACEPVIVTVGGSTTCTATVTDTGSGAVTPGGTVGLATDSPGAFQVGSSLGPHVTGPGPYCNLAATGIAGTASCVFTYTPSAIGSGTHTITGSYSGNTGHTPSQGSTQLGVVLAATSASVLCGSSPAAVGHATSCLATVADAATGHPSPTGLVRFLTDSRGSFAADASCKLTPAGAGSASCALDYTPLAVGRFGVHEISVSYMGDAAHATSFGTTQLDVTRGATDTSLRCRASRRRSAICDITVAETRSGTSTPTGRIAVTVPAALDGHGSCRLRSRRPGMAACTVRYTVRRSGRYRVTAAYGGDSNHLGSAGSTRLHIPRSGG